MRLSPLFRSAIKQVRIALLCIARQRFLSPAIEPPCFGWTCYRFPSSHRSERRPSNQCVASRTMSSRIDLKTAKYLSIMSSCIALTHRQTSKLVMRMTSLVLTLNPKKLMDEHLNKGPTVVIYGIHRGYRVLIPHHCQLFEMTKYHTTSLDSTGIIFHKDSAYQPLLATITHCQSSSATVARLDMMN